jgi:peptidoglycan/xylan/chitin deacetylase (PgdA/CDA1 family)
MKLDSAEAEIDHGIAAVEAAVYGEPGGQPRTPFFRFPGFVSSPALLERLKRRGIVVFGADLWPGDWNKMTPEHERALLLQRLTKTGGGIVLLHDTQPKTAAMLPELLRELKRRDFRWCTSCQPKLRTALNTHGAPLIIPPAQYDRQYFRRCRVTGEG